MSAGNGHTIWLPGQAGEPDQQKYMPHLKHVHGYLQEQHLDPAERVAVAMVATVAEIRELMAQTPRAAKGRIIRSALTDFEIKLRRYL